MKLALLAQHFAPHFEGGTEAVVRAQARELSRLGHDVRVVSGTDRPHGGEDVVREVVDGIPVDFLPRRPDERFDLLLERPRIRALVLEAARGCDLAHLHHWSTLDASLARALGPRMAVVVTLHDLFATCPRFFRRPVPPVERCPGPGDVEPCATCVSPAAPGIPLSGLRTDLEARAAALGAELDAAAALVAPSRAHARALATLLELPRGRLRVVENGLCRGIGPLEPCEPFRPGGTLRVLHAGHRSEVKGTLDLVRALAGLPGEERSRVRLLLAGRALGPGFDDLLRREGEGLSMAFLGAYDHDALSELVSSAGGAHLAALPSQAHESYGLVLDEVHALGLPAWVSDRGAPRERLGGGGRVLPAGDAGAWRDAFRSIFARPEDLDAEARAVPRVVRTAADAARELDELYRSLPS